LSTDFLNEFFEVWDVSLAVNHSILALIRITNPIQEFLTEFPTEILTEFQTLPDRGNCKNFAASAALAEICRLRSYCTF